MWLGCRRHKDGLSLLMLAASQVHDWFGEWGERLVTVLGGRIMAVGHVRNYRLCRSDQYSV